VLAALFLVLRCSLTCSQDQEFHLQWEENVVHSLIGGRGPLGLGGESCITSEMSHCWYYIQNESTQQNEKNAKANQCFLKGPGETIER